MSAKFRIQSKRNVNSVSMQLQGDFDGTSAHELVNRLDACDRSLKKIAIDTDGLRSIDAFGLDVFISRMKLSPLSLNKIVFSGRFENNFAQQ